MELGASEYERLPACIKALYSERDWQWLPDERKARLIQDETEPECE